jgi:DNA-binding NarL/FixJ family response regulator
MRSGRKKITPTVPAEPSSRTARVTRSTVADVDASSHRPSRGLRVLCVDDHDVLIEGLKARFDVDGGIEIVGRLPSAAKLEAEVSRLRPDVVIMDIEMPGPDAFETSDRMRRRHPDVPVLVLSAHIRDSFISASYRAGMSGYFAKSDDLRDIIRGIYEVAKNRPGSFLLGPRVAASCRSPQMGAASNAAGSAPPAALAINDEPHTLMSTLTARQVEVLRMIGKGMTRVQIAKEISRSPKTVDAHQHRLMLRLGVDTRADLMRLAIREGLAQA